MQPEHPSSELAGDRQTSYDLVHYPTHAYYQTHPDRLASLATIFGMNPAPVDRCRVLELGCGNGGNLLPMAFGLPGSRFLGIDISSAPIRKGREAIRDLGLKNIDLRRMDLMDVPPDLGPFDYIIAHGLYSWVPEPARDRILAICAASLSPNGLAYVSYNAYPGCKLREMIREIMLFHTREVNDPREQLAQARAVIRWLADAQTESNAYSQFLREMVENLDQKHDSVVFHDELSPVNLPVHFYQFIAHAARHGLQFVSEAEYFDTADQFPSESAEQLRELARETPLAAEQYRDFLTGRSFRQTVLCRHHIQLDRSLNPDRVNAFWIRSPIRPAAEEPDIRGSKVESFQGPKESTISTGFPPAKAALVHIGRIYPRSIRFDDLAQVALSEAGEGKDGSADEETRMLAEFMIRVFGNAVADLHLHEPQFAVEPAERPLASPLARLQARHGSLVSTLLHSNTRLEDEAARHLLILLDGTRDRQALSREMQMFLESAARGSSEDPEHVGRGNDFRVPPEQLETKLAMLGRLGLLLA